MKQSPETVTWNGHLKKTNELASWQAHFYLQLYHLKSLFTGICTMLANVCFLSMSSRVKSLVIMQPMGSHPQ